MPVTLVDTHSDPHCPLARAGSLGVVALVAAVALAGCGSGGGGGGGGSTGYGRAPRTHHVAASAHTTTASSHSSGSGSGKAGVTVAVASTSLGRVLVGQGGRTLYVYTPDPRNKSVCTGACVAAWPALGATTAGTGVSKALLGTIKRSDGTTQTTYAGHPLYYYAGDQARGDVNGQGVQGIWWVITASGKEIKKSGSGGSGKGGSGY